MDFQFFSFKKTIVVTLKTFEQIFWQKLWPNFITTPSLYNLDVYVQYSCLQTSIGICALFYQETMKCWIHRYLSNIDSVLLWNLVTTFVKKSAPKFSVWPQLFKFLYQFTFWIVLIFLIFFLFLSPNLIFAFWNATWWHFKIFHKNLNLRFLFNNLSHWWKSKQFAPKF